MSGDSLDQVLGQRFAQVLTEFTEGLPAEAVMGIPGAAGVDATTLGRWGKTGNVRMPALLRLNDYFTSHGRVGFIERVLDLPAMALATWSAEQLPIEQVVDPRFRALIEASGRIGESPIAWLAKVGLLEECHVILQRDTELISTYIGRDTLVSRSLLGRDVRARRNRSYADRLHEQFIQARDGSVLHAMQDTQENGYLTLKLPFRESAGAPLQFVTVPHRLHTAQGYVVS